MQDHLALSRVPAGKGSPATQAPQRRADHVCARGLMLGSLRRRASASERGRRRVHRPGRVARRPQRHRPAGRNARDLRRRRKTGGGWIRGALEEVRISVTKGTYVIEESLLKKNQRRVIHRRLTPL